MADQVLTESSALYYLSKYDELDSENRFVVVRELGHEKRIWSNVSVLVGRQEFDADDIKHEYLVVFDTTRL